MPTQSEALSPWGMSPAKQVKINPLKEKFKAKIAIPGSKSFTNRALVLSAMAEGTSCLVNPLFSDDSYWCADAFSKLGVKIESNRPDRMITVDGIGKMGSLRNIDIGDLPYIGSAGTIARFLPGVIAAKGEGEVIITSSKQLARRPVNEMINGLRQLGAKITMGEGTSFPMTIQGGSLKGGEAIVSGAVSSQYISGLLLAAPLAKEPVVIKVSDYIVQSDYVRITLDLMEQFGVKVSYNESLTEFRIEPQNYVAKNLQLEADASTSTYFFALAAASNSSITITNLNLNTRQPDFGFIRHLETLGCDVKQQDGEITIIGPPSLVGNKSFDFSSCSDSTPALIAITPFANGPIEVRGVSHIRTHECDRISVMRQSLESSGLIVDEFDDGLKVTPVINTPIKATIDPHDDHRMGMAFSVMAAAGNGAIIIDPSCVSKTCPNFYELIADIGVDIDITNI